LPRKKYSHLSLRRYEEDSLTIHTNARRGWLMYLRFPADNGVYTHDVDYAGDPDVEEVFMCACGIDLEFAARKTLPRELALRAVREFFTTGELPRCVPWTGPEGKAF
jgi:Immunity protein Imm1